jgi:hypothetical protein
MQISHIFKMWEILGIAINKIDVRHLIFLYI